MRKLRKGMALLLALVLCVGTLGACGGQDEKEDKAGTENQMSNEGNSKGVGEQKDEEPYEIIIDYACSGMEEADLEEVEAAINEITLPAINCTIKFFPITTADHVTKLSLLVSTGEKIDLINTGARVSPSGLYSDGVLADISDLLYEYAPKLVEKNGSLLQIGMFDDGIYAVAGSFYPGEKNVILYNKDMAEEYGIEIPERVETYDDFIAFLESAQAKLPDNIYAMTLGDGGTSTAWNFGYFDSMGDTAYLMNGVLTDVEGGTELVNWYKTDEYKESLEAVREIYTKNLCIPDSLTNGIAAKECMQAGQALCFYRSINADRNEENPGGALGLNLGVIDIGPENENITIITTATASTMSFGVSVTSERPEKVVQFLELLYDTPELMNLMNYGIEGKHYVKVDSNNTEQTGIITYPEGVDGTNVGYTGSAGWWGNHKEAYAFAPYTENYYNILDNYGMEKAVVSNALGFTFDKTNVETQVAAVTSVMQTYRPSLHCGIVDVDEKLPEFIAALEEAGMSEIIDECQKQYTEWLNNK